MRWPFLRLAVAARALPTAGCAPEPPELEVGSRPLVWQTRSLQPHSVCLVAGGHHQHHALGLRVVHRGGVEPGILGSDEPLHGGQWSGHNGKLIHGAKSQIRICVLGAYSLRHAALSQGRQPSVRPAGGGGEKAPAAMKRIRAATGTPTSRNLIVRHAYVEERPCHGGQNAPLASTPANCSGRELLPPPSEPRAGLPRRGTALREVRHPQPPLTAPLRRKHTPAARRPPGRTAERLKSRSLAHRCRAIRYPITLRISNLPAIGE